MGVRVNPNIVRMVMHIIMYGCSLSEIKPSESVCGLCDECFSSCVGLYLIKKVMASLLTLSHDRQTSIRVWL